MDNKVRESHIKNFVQYNIYYDKKKPLYYQRYIYVIVSLLISVIILLKKLDWIHLEAGLSVAKIAIISFEGLYCIITIFTPIWYRYSNKYNEREALLLMHIFNDIIGCIGYVYISFIACIFPIQPYIVSIIGLFLLGLSYFVIIKNRRMLIEKLIVSDGFDVEKNNDAFKKLDNWNKRLRTTPSLVATFIILGTFLKRSASGITILGFIIAFSTVILMDVPICGLLQIKYAREYGLQDYLPTKSRKEVEEEQRK